MGNYLKGQIEIDLTLSTLAAKTLVKELVADTVVDTTLLTSIVCSYALALWSPAQNDGPILVGVAHSDYSVAEIEQAIENTDTWSANDKIAQEQAKRLVRKIGVFDAPANAAEISRLNNGVPIKTKLNWKLSEGETVQFWAYNMGSSALATTSPEFFAIGHANLFRL